MPDPLSLVPADSIDDEARAALLNAVYSDYDVPMTIDTAGLRAMQGLFDLDPGRSFVARRESATVGVVMLGLRGERAWIGGMGTVPAARREGLGTRLMCAAITAARAAGARELGLEVLEQNAPAIALYERLGFTRVRELEVWWWTEPLAPVPGVTVDAGDPAEAGAAIAAWRCSPEPWQRGDATVAHLRAGGAAVHGLLAREHGRLTGAVLARDAGGRTSLLQIGADPAAAVGPTRALLSALVGPAAPQGARALNLPAEEPAARALRAGGATLEARQIEMRLPL